MFCKSADFLATSCKGNYKKLIRRKAPIFTFFISHKKVHFTMKIIYFAPIPYADIKQRPQCLAEEISRYHEVWYIDPTITGMRCLKKRDWDFHSYQYDVNPRLHIFRPNGLFAAHIRLQYYDKLHINTWFERLQLRKLLYHADLVWIGYEACYRLIINSRIFSGKKEHCPLLVYDKMDDNVALEQNACIRQFLRQMRSELEHKADVIFVTATVFYHELYGKFPCVQQIPNGGYFERKKPKSFQNHPLPPAKKRRFGYIGTISHWFDQDLIRMLAASIPECEIALVGPTLIEKIDLPNIHYYGTIPKEQVPDWIQCFDVCLYPFKESSFLDTIDPVKIYEYLAENKPVIAVDSAEMEKYKNCIYTYQNPDEFLTLCRQEILRNPFPDSDSQKEFFFSNSWHQRGHLVLNTITDYMRQKEIVPK